LTGSCFEETELIRTTFDEANLIKCSFKNAKNYDIDPAKNKIKNAIFSFPECLSLLKSYEINIE